MRSAQFIHLGVSRVSSLAEYACQRLSMRKLLAECITTQIDL